MRLVAESGLWSTGTHPGPTPLVAVLEVSGAVFEWPIDDDAAAPSITFTDLSDADWLWRLVGEAGHSAVAAAVDGRVPDDDQTVDVSGVALLPGSVDPLRRLAFGHWLRRWWPASHRDGIAVLDTALLDAEIALLTSAAQDFFAEDTVDSDVTELLGAHSAAFDRLVATGDPRVVELIRSAAELTDGGEISLAGSPAAPRRDDYALAAGAVQGRRSSTAIAGGTASVRWAGVPPAVFDAAEDTVEWFVDATPSGVSAVVAVELLGLGSPEGIAVGLRCGGVAGGGSLDERGQCVMPLLDADGAPMAESAAWNQDWQSAAVTVGVGVEESEETRNRVRDVARTRLATPAGDAFLAEVIAAESDY
jgi:hypothetical protein